MRRSLLLATGLAAALSAVHPFPARAQGPPSGPETLTLREVYDLARERSPVVHAAGALAEAAGTRVPGAGLPPDPALRFGIMNAALPSLSTDMPNSMAPAVELMQRLPFPGKLSLRRRIAERSGEMADADAAETWWSVRTRAARAFYELYAVDRRLEVMRETVRLLEDFERVAKAMYAAGTGRQSDVLRASVEVARADADITRLDAMRETAAARLNAVLDRPADTPVPTPVLPPLPDTVPDRAELRGWAERDRPLLERSRLRVDRADARVDLARKALWPDFTIGVQYGQRAADPGTARMGGIMVGFTLPVFASRRQLEERDEADALRRMAAAGLREARAAVDARIGELLAELGRARTLIDLYAAEVLPQAEANVESSLSSYRVGSVDFMTLVDAQVSTNRYQQEYYGLVAEYGRAVAELEMTVGRGLPASPVTLSEAR